MAYLVATIALIAAVLVVRAQASLDGRRPTSLLGDDARG
jgi:hypothetical protein